MPVRKIPPNRRVPTGYFYSHINARLIDCESPVERDFYQTLEDQGDIIEKYEEQPLKIEKRRNGKSIPLFPDCLITYKPWTKKRPCLVEIKTEEEIKDPGKTEEFKVDCDVLSAYAKEHNMDFKVVLDTDIRGQYLDNLKFLYKYRDKPGKLGEFKNIILTTVKTKGSITVSEILDILAKDKTERAHILPSIWHLLQIKAVKTDLHKPLTNSSPMEMNNEKTVDKER